MIAWVDTETSGLDERCGLPLLFEIAIVLTDDDLVEKGTISIPIVPDLPWDYVISHLDPVVIEMHTKSGLFADVQQKQALHIFDAETMLCDWIGDVASETGFDPKKTPLGGSCVDFDRRWLRECASRIEAMFHHTSIDVSTLNQIAKRWNPSIYEGRPKDKAAHRALADARESIAYLKYYRETGFIGSQK